MVANLPVKPSDDVLSVIDNDMLYSPETGELVWLRPTSFSVKPGQRVGCLTKKGYLVCCVRGKSLKVHHIAWYKAYGEWPTTEIDHENGNRANNPIGNLRPATSQQNRWNSKAFDSNSLNEKGITYRNRGKKRFAVDVQCDGERLTGFYLTLDEAKQVRDAFYKARHKEFVRL